MERIGGAVSGVGRIIRAMLGAPDYERYVAHIRSAHPDREPVTCAQFMKERMENRYNKPGARCC